MPMKQLLLICIIAYCSLPLQMQAAQTTVAKQEATELELQMISYVGRDFTKIKEALDAGARIDAQDADGWSVLLNAVTVNKTFVYELINLGVNLNIQDRD